MQTESKPLRFLLRSPIPLFIFIIIPAALILSTLLHFPLPFRITKRMLLYNNVGLLLFLGGRLLTYLAGLRRSLRYGEGTRPSGAALTPARPAALIRDQLAEAGFQLNADGSYAEKHERGYLGTVMIYGGLFLLLFIGTWENMYQFSGTLLHGIGIPADLSKRGAYFPLMMGPFASPAGLPKLEVTKQVFASSTYPKGASDIVLWSKEGKPLGSATIIGSGEPYRYQGYDIYLSKQLVDAALTLKEKDDPNQIVYLDSVKLSPLWKKEGDYSMYGTFRTPKGHEGEAFYNPDKKVFKFILTREGKTVLDTEYVLHQYRSKEVGDFVMSLDALGNWSEIHVVRRRHMEMLWVGGVIALLGLILRIAFRPQRVWLEETPEGSRAWAIGGETRRIVEG
ncbi:MAG: hypothetical protein A2075_06030 [Geobacteraceae bacterium GWC2_58_44]|nr:MAG: hypothetical protein A2075_06030 [Geobacteraceae bacterium GWC2_58_44]HBG05721.1 hypothetical protein [Geobacter sp.]